VAKQSESGCGLLAICLGVLFALGKCSGTSPPSLVTTEEAAKADATEKRYVSASALNCRDTASKHADLVTKLSFADQVDVQQQEGDWSEVSAAGGGCWVLSKHLSLSYPVRAYQPPRRLKALRPKRQCGSKRTCGEMDSCPEANFYLDECGISRLDGDGDGVPCESICG
jgi:hypothetical protein